LNKSGVTEAEAQEERRPAKRNVLQDPMSQTQSWTHDRPVVLERIRQAVRRNRKEQLTALYHHVYAGSHRRAAYNQLQRQAAAGVDGETWQTSGQGLEARLTDLSNRLRRGAYRALPVRRGYIPKPDGRQRPLGIPMPGSYCTSILGAWEFLDGSVRVRNGRHLMMEG
jgi:RNA-directed DNA polymerase